MKAVYVVIPVPGLAYRKAIRQAEEARPSTTSAVRADYLI
jgi:hypothetical protein